LSNQRKKSGLFDIFNDFCPDLTVPAEDPEDRLLRGPSASFRSGIPDNLSLILPSSSEIDFIDLNGAREDVRDILCQDHSNFKKCPEHSLLVKTGLFNNRIFCVPSETGG
jgi:hypothetical protein